MRTYLDHNATSPMPPSVRELLVSALSKADGNPSSPHAEGQAARHLLEQSRETIARLAGARSSEIVFTSGGTESNNAALRGALRAYRRRHAGTPARIVTTAIEHPSILETCRSLEEEGAIIDHLPCGSDGTVDPGDLAASLGRAPAAIVSAMHANNETGAIQPVLEMAGIAREHGAIFHCDAVQSAGKVDIRPVVRAADLVSIASHKLGGPPGVGVLVVRDGAPWEASATGGAQEGRRRAGTEPAALAAAFARALDLSEGEPGNDRIRAMRDWMESLLPEIDADVVLHGARAPRLPNTTHAWLPSAPGRLLVVQLDLMGFAISTGAACSTGTSRPSHVLAAMGCSPQEAADSLRISLGASTAPEEIRAFARALADAVRALRTGRPVPLATEISR